MQKMQHKEKFHGPAILGCLKRDGIGATARQHKKRIRLQRAYAFLVVAAILWLLFSWLLGAQPSPPLPPQPLTVRISWDRLADSEYYRAADTNGVLIPLTYRVYNATNITGPWFVAGATTNTATTLTNLNWQTQFFYVTASNVFLESDRSELLSLPFGKVNPPNLIFQP